MAAAPNRRLTWIGCFGMGLIGVCIAALGPGLPSIAARAQIPLARAGLVFTAIFVGGLFTSLGAGRAMDRLGRRPLLIAGALVHAAGCLALSVAHSGPQALGSGVLLGIGDSTLVVGYHVLFAELFPQTSGAALSRLNVFFGVGALAGPALAALSLLAVGDIRYALWLVAAAQCFAASVLARAAFPAAPAVRQGDGGLGLRQLLRRRLLWLLALLLLLYVALEAAMGNWAYTYLRGSGGFGVLAASLITSAYWLALTFGRALGPYALRRLSEPLLLLAVAVGTALVAALLVAVAGWRPGAAACIVLLGLGFGPLWPLAFAVGAGVYQEGAGAVSGMLTMAGSIGGIGGPWLQGLLLLEHGVYAGMAFTFVGSAGVAVLAFAALRSLPAAQRQRAEERAAAGSGG